MDCLQPQLMCTTCCLEAHRLHPFHRVEKWTGAFFEATTLNNEGYVMHLGHCGDECPFTEKGPVEVVDDSDMMQDNADWETVEEDVLIFVDVSGVHHIKVRWCRCAQREDKHIQLLRARTFPASLKRPSTAFTFQLLQYYHIDAVECKTSGLNFFSKLRRLTNYLDPTSVPVSVLSFPPMMWCVLISIAIRIVIES